MKINEKYDYNKNKNVKNLFLKKERDDDFVFNHHYHHLKFTTKRKFHIFTFNKPLVIKVKGEIKGKKKPF